MRSLFSPVRASGARAETQSAGGGVEIDLTNPQHVAYLRSGGATLSGAYVGEDTALRIGAAYRCIHILAGVPGNMPIDLRKQVTARETQSATDHPSYPLLTTRPNHWQTPQDFKRMLTAHVAMRGNGYALKVKGVRGIQGLWPIHPDRCRPKMSPAMELIYEYTSPRGQTVPLAADEVFHVRGLTLDGFTGLGALAFARETIGTTLQAQKAAAKMWKQGAMVGGALEHPGQLSDEAFARLKTSLEERNSGAENVGKWLVLEEGMKAADVFLSATDMQFLESRQFGLREIAMFFGVPPHMIGDTEKSTSWGSGIEQQKDGFVAFTAEDYLTAWEQTARRDLLSPQDAPTHYFRFTRAALIRGDIKTRYAAYGTAIEKRIATPNEIRALEDMNPRVGGDDFADQPTAKSDPAKPADDEEKDPADA